MQETPFYQTRHAWKYKLDERRDQDTNSLFDWNCSLEKYTSCCKTQVCDYCKGEEADNRHTQKLLIESSLGLCEIIEYKVWTISTWVLVVY